MALGVKAGVAAAVSYHSLTAAPIYQNLIVRTRTALPVTARLAALESRWTALPNRARSVVGEYPGGLNETGTYAGSVLSAELAGSAPPQADGIVR